MAGFSGGEVTGQTLITLGQGQDIGKLYLAVASGRLSLTGTVSEEEVTGQTLIFFGQGHDLGRVSLEFTGAIYAANRCKAVSFGGRLFFSQEFSSLGNLAADGRLSSCLEILVESFNLLLVWEILGPLQSSILNLRESGKFMVVSGATALTCW